MDDLGLEVTKEYHDLYAFDSKKVKCLGVIKDLVASLTQLPLKSIGMDIVVVYIPPHFQMFLSRYCSRKIGGAFQIYMSFSTILVFGGEFRRLYQETRLYYIISDHENIDYHPIYAKECELGSSMLHLVIDHIVVVPIINKGEVSQQNRAKNIDSNQI